MDKTIRDASFTTFSSLSTSLLSPLSLREAINRLPSEITISVNALRVLLAKHRPSLSAIAQLPNQRIAESESVYNGSSITYVGCTSVDLNMKCKTKLQSFLNLEPNWDGYGAESFSEEYIERALNYLDQFSHETEVFPSADGLVKFEFHNDNNAYLEIEISNDGTLEVYEVFSDGSDREYTEQEEAILRIVDDFYG